MFSTPRLAGALALLLVGASASDGAEVRIGARLGLNLSRAIYEFELLDPESDRFRPGFAGGLIVTVPVSRGASVSLESGLLYEMKGGTTDPGEDRNRLVWKLDYLTIPLHVRVSIPAGGSGFYVKAGPELNVLLSARREEPTFPEGTRHEIDIRDDFRSTDVALALGAGLERSLGPVRGFAEIGYSHGLTDVLDVEGAVLDVEVRNRSIRFAIGCRFR